MEMQTTEDVHTAKIEIFDPPMCCPTGLCDPNIDPALLDVNEAILRIQKAFAGKVEIQRYLLSQQGPKFMQTKEVMELLKKHGVEILPITMADGKIVKQKAYPNYEEMKSYAEGGR